MREGLRALVRDLRARFGGRLFGLLALMVVSGSMEGIGLLLLVPLLGAIGIGDQGADGRVGRFFQEAFASLGLTPDLELVLLLVVITFLLQNLAFLGQSHLAARYQHHYAAEWRRDLCSAFMDARWLFFTQRRGGVLVNALIQECNRLGGAFYLVIQLAVAAVISSLYTTMALLTSWPVTVVLISVAVALLWMTRGLMRWGHRTGEAITEANERLTSLAGEFIGGAKTIKAGSTEAAADARFSEAVEASRRLSYWSSLQPNLLRSIFELVTIVTLCSALAVGVRAAVVGTTEIVVVLALFFRMYPRLAGVQQNLQLLSVYLPAISAAQRLLAEARAEAETLDDGALPAGVAGPGGASIALQQLHASYEGVEVLHGVSLEIPAGSIVGIVGASGAGKTTLADCLLGLVRPAAGRIAVDGVDLAELPLRAWRRRIGYVGQDTFLFNAPITDNLLWGALPGVGREELDRATREAHADGFVAALPRGYETEVGDRGVRMSGGQRQRLGLARALVGRPALLVLDEATSALDSESERVVLDAIAALRGQTTVVTIAHRLSSVRMVDVIFVLEGGRLVESGSWTDLVASGGRFAALWKSQVSGEPDAATRREPIGDRPTDGR